MAGVLPAAGPLERAQALDAPRGLRAVRLQAGFTARTCGRVHRQNLDVAKIVALLKWNLGDWLYS
jgi:hypothetical protein